MAEIIEELCSELDIPVIRRGDGMILIRHPDVLRVVRAAILKGYWTLGIEGFYEKGQSLMPDMNCIADFSAICGLPPGQRGDASLRDAELFMKRCGDPRMLFEIVLAE
jgi:hypothetical protein